MDDGVFRFEFGDFVCYSISDGTKALGAELLATFFAGSTAEALESAYGRHGVSPDTFELDFNCLLIDTGSERILIDTGCGPAADPDLGKLLTRLRLAGFQPEDIDLIVLTHGHYDHVCGGVDGDGAMVFPNARQLMVRGEWQYWAHDLDLSSLEKDAAEDVRATRDCLLAMQAQIELIDAGDEVAAGIQTLATPGHTRNHISVAVQSGGQELLCLADTMDTPIHVEYTHWHPAWDELPETGIQSRRQLLQRAVDNDALIHGFHFPFPGLGRIRESGDGWRFEPMHSF